MIEYMKIENFQSHRSTRIDFSPQTTAITGLSMSGKTAIKRALEWVRKNRPMGFRFNYRYDDKPTVVEIGVDGHIIQMAKGDKPLDDDGNLAYYYIKYPDGKEDYFTAFGTSVPVEVSTLLGISDISIQDQLDAYLLVISSTGEIARTIHKITGIDIGDAWLKEINKSHIAANKEASKLDGEIEFLTRDVKKYEGVDEVKKEIDAAQLLQADFDDLVRKHNDIVDTINKHSSSELWAKESKEQLEPFQDLLNRLEEAQDVAKKLRQQIEDINEAMLTGEALNELRSALSFLSPELEKVEAFIDLKKRRDGVAMIISDVSLSESSISGSKKILDEKRNELVDVMLVIKKCYICGGELTDRKKILESL